MNGKTYVNEIRKRLDGKMLETFYEDLPVERIQQTKANKELYEKVMNVEFVENYYNEYVREFISYQEEKVQAKLKDVYVGVLPTYKINASTIMESCLETPVIIVHAQLMAAISQYCEATMIFTKTHPDSSIAENYDWYKSVLKEIVTCFKYNQYAVKMKIMPPILDEEEMTIVYNQVIILEMFIIAHELAHIYLGHLNKEDVKNVKLWNDGEETVEINVCNSNKVKELKADALAMVWMLNAIDNATKIYPFGSYQEAPCLILENFHLFNILEVSSGFLDDIINKTKGLNKKEKLEVRFKLFMDKLECMLSNGDETEETHPYAIERLIYLNMVAYLANLFEEEGKRYLHESIFDALDFESYDMR